jgi:hypothetical protein
MSSVIFRALGNAASKASCVIVLPMSQEPIATVDPTFKPRRTDVPADRCVVSAQ